MKHLEQALARGRASWRKTIAGVPGLRRSMHPVRLVLDGRPKGEGDLTLEQWRAPLVQWVQWLGPSRVVIKAGAEQMGWAMDMVRFAHRLECPTQLVLTGAVEPVEAISFVDRGLGAASIRVAGLDEATHGQVLEGSLEAASNAVQAFSQARMERARPLVIHVNLVLHADNLSSLSSMAGWARQAGADELSVGLPLGHEVPVDALRYVEDLSGVVLPGGLGALLRGERAPSKGLGALLCADGSLYAALELGPLGRVQDDSMERIWRSNRRKVLESRRLRRPYDELEMYPIELMSIR